MSLTLDESLSGEMAKLQERARVVHSQLMHAARLARDAAQAILDAGTVTEATWIPFDTHVEHIRAVQARLDQINQDYAMLSAFRVNHARELRAEPSQASGLPGSGPNIPCSVEIRAEPAQASWPPPPSVPNIPISVEIREGGRR